MSEARILAAFWQPKAKRFCELTSEEVTARCGYGVSSREFQALAQTRVILSSGIPCEKKTRLYRLSAEGEDRVAAMIRFGTMPKPSPRLTAIPREAAE